jgi:hypothetical protein
MAFRLSVRLESDLTGSLNPAFCDFSFTGVAANEATCTAQTIAYVAHAMKSVGHSGVRLIGVQGKLLPGGQSVDIPFPRVEYDNLFNNRVGDRIPAFANGYGDEVGPNNTHSSGRGDSVCVQTITGRNGRSGRGRHFLPFCCREAIGDDGLFGITLAQYLQIGYSAYILGELNGINAAVVPLEPIVWSNKLGSGTFIRSARLTTVPSRLRSRIR